MTNLYEMLQNSLIHYRAIVQPLITVEQFPNINYLNRNKEGLLHEIAMNNDISFLKLLIDKRKDLDLDIENQHGSTPLILSIKFKNYALAKILIAANCNLNKRNSNGETALHFAVGKNSPSLVEELIKRGAEINSQSKNGKTPLGYLLCSDSNAMNSILKILLDNGADVNIPDNFHCTPLHLCVYSQSDERLLTMLDYNPNLNMKHYCGLTVLLCIVKKYGDERATLRALELDCDLELGDVQDNTPLHYAVIMNLTILAYELIKKGADVNSRNFDGSTPLHLAEFGSEMFDILVYYGANPNVLNKNNDSRALRALRTPEYNFSKFVIESGDYFIGDEQYYILGAILENPSEWRNNRLLGSVLEKFENFIDNATNKSFEKIAFVDIYQWETENSEDFDSQGVGYFEDFISILNEIKSENFSAKEYFSFDCYYGLLWKSCEFSKTPRCERMKIIWRSLSFGIFPEIGDITDVISYYGLNSELYALIFGGFTKALIRASYSDNSFAPYDIFFEFLHCDIDSKKGKQLQNEIILHESVRNRFRMLEFLSFFNFNVVDLDTSMVAFPKFILDDVKKMNVKSLQELSRNKVRACIRTTYRTKNFYEIHQVISNLNIPSKIKKYLQLLVPNKCPVCNVRSCDCLVYNKCNVLN